MKTLRSSGHVALTTTLKDARRDAGLTQAQLAKILRRTQGWVWKVETGERGIDPIQCADWARACGISPRVFFNRFTDALMRRV